MAKTYRTSKLDTAKNFEKHKAKPETLEIEIPEIGASKIGITRRSHSKSKKLLKMADKSRKLNRKCKHNKNRI